MTGILDHPILSGDINEEITNFYGKRGPLPLETILEILKEKAVDTNKKWSSLLGINQATAVTCVKPSGTVSQLCDTASGIHPRYSKYYVRTVRADNKDPLCIMMKDQGISWEPASGKEESTTVFSFPICSPDDSVFRDDRNAISQLEFWKLYQLHFCEHKPSVTIYVKESEWLDVFAWVYSNFDVVSGISFLPHSDHNYQQAPYQEITEEEYLLLKKDEKSIIWDALLEYETVDATTSTKEYACSGGQCEI